MTDFTASGWIARVERDPLSFSLRMVLAERSASGADCITGISRNPMPETVHVRATEVAPDETWLRIPDDAARALYDALAQHFAGEAGSRQTRADLLHERGRVDKMIDALLKTRTA